MYVYLSPENIALWLIAVFSLLLAGHIWQRRYTPGTLPLGLLLITNLAWALGTAAESAPSLAPAVTSQFYWHYLAVSGTFLLPLAWLLFIIYETGRVHWLTRRNVLLFSLLPVLLVILIWTNGFHNLVWRNPFPNNGILGLNPVSNIGPAGWAVVTMSYLSGIFSTALIFHSLINSKKQNRVPFILLGFCTLASIAAAVYTFLRYSEVRTDGMLLYVHCFCNLIFVFVLFRYRLVNILPFAFDAAIAGLKDGIVILSPQNQIIFMNEVAGKILRKAGKDYAGKNAEQVFSGFPTLLEKVLGKPLECQDKISLSTSDGREYYELNLSVIQGYWKNSLGRLIVLRNITHRVEAEESSRRSLAMLAQSEDLYRQLVENINEVIFILNPDGVFSYISPVVERATGFSPQEMIGQHYEMFVHPEDLEFLRESIQKSMDGQSSSSEFRVIKKNGSIAHILADYRRLVHNGRFAGIHGVLTDITKRKNAEVALDRRVNQLMLLNEIGEKISAVMEIDSIFTSVTHLIRENFGYYYVALFIPDPENQTVRLRSTSGAFSSNLPRDHTLNFGQGMVGWVAQNQIKLLANDVLEEPSYINLYPDKIITRSELTVPISLGEELVGVLDIQSPRVNAFDENDVRVMKTVADQIAVAIENSRLYEEVRLQLRERERKENILRIQRDLVVGLNSTTRLNDMLHVAVEILSIELYESAVAIFLLDRRKKITATSCTSQYPKNVWKKKDWLANGNVGWVSRHRQPALISDLAEAEQSHNLPSEAASQITVPLLSGARVIGIVDIQNNRADALSAEDLHLVTILADNLVVLVEKARLFEEVERARNELQKRANDLEAANERLRELDRLKSQFLANMSHELRTPLNSIIGFSEILIDEVTGPLNDEQRECALDIHESGAHLLALISDLLDFSKIEAGRMALDYSGWSVKEFFEELRTTISPLTEKKAQLLSFQSEPDLPCATADRVRMKQVFINLLSNANKFTPNGGLISVSCWTVKPDRMLFAVSDTGIGIKTEDQHVIFEEFRQADGTLTREAPGTGLGLAISKRIVELHQGMIWVESEFGKGSTFYVSLPILQQGDMI